MKLDDSQIDILDQIADEVGTLKERVRRFINDQELTTQQADALRVVFDGLKQADDGLRDEVLI